MWDAAGPDMPKRRQKLDADTPQPLSLLQMERFLSCFSLQTSGEALVHCLEVTVRILFAAPCSLHAAAAACARAAIGPTHGPPNFIAPIALKFLVHFLADPASPSSGATAKEVRT